MVRAFYDLHSATSKLTNWQSWSRRIRIYFFPLRLTSPLRMLLLDYIIILSIITRAFVYF